MQIFRPVDHDRSVAALTREARTSAARKDWRLKFPAEGYRFDHVLLSFWNYDADRHLPIVGGISRVNRSTRIVETNLALDSLGKLFFERCRVDICRRVREAL